MALRKFASFDSSQILDVKGSEHRSRVASLDKIADFHDYRTDDGYLYARIRAISSRVNKNNDGWPSVELAGSSEIFDRHQASEGGFTVEAADGSSDYGYATFVGKPIFVDHHNSNPERARGVIVDAKFHVEDHHTASKLDPYYATAPEEHMPPAWVELLLEIDAKSFPRLAKAIIDGSKNSAAGIDGFSMGCDVDKSICNICKNAATSPDEYCEHIKHKGATFNYIDTETGKRTSKKSYEDCYGIKFFEISAVFDPADETALVREVRHAAVNEGKTADRSENEPPQDDLNRAPTDVDTLREEKICPICGSTIDHETCDVCGYITPPEGFGNPDLDAAKQNELSDPDAALVPQPGEEARKAVPTPGITSSMKWQPIINSRVANRGGGDEPDEVVISDETQPVTTRTAQSLIASADRNQEATMQKNAEAAAGAPEAATPDKRVDVEGVGGVMDASAEQSSKADAQVDVTGKGGTGVEDTSPDEKQSVEETSDNAGFDQGGNPGNNSGPTKTWPKGNQANPVSDKAFPTAAKKGTDPVDSVGKPDERVDVEEQVTVNWGESATGTHQWTGTGGNGVTRQQAPVTQKPTQSGGVTSHVVNIFKLADTEVEMGLISADKKYERIAELEAASPEAVEGLLAYASRVKQAGLTKSRTAGVQRLPSFSRVAKREEPAPQPVDESFLDSSLFT